MELETSIGYSFSLIKTEYKQNKIYQNKKKTKRTVNLSFQSALCQQSERSRRLLRLLCTQQLNQCFDHCAGSAFLRIG